MILRSLIIQTDLLLSGEQLPVVSYLITGFVRVNSAGPPVVPANDRANPCHKEEDSPRTLNKRSVWTTEYLDVDRSPRSQDPSVFSASSFRTSLMTLREMLGVNWNSS